jgi:CDP-diacylglycerol--glycerol-3-phosphate 3-phosphatidyltransferase
MRGEGRFSARDLLTPPNLVTLARIALVPVALSLLASERRLAALVVILIMLASDGLDGYLARRTGRVTDLGKVLDPVADKIAIDSVLIFLAARGEFPVGAVVLFVVRDVAGLVGAVVVSRRLPAVLAANRVGKIGFVVLSAMLVAYVADFAPLEVPLMIAGVTLAVASGIIYAVEARRAVAAARLANS